MTRGSSGAEPAPRGERPNVTQPIGSGSERAMSTRRPGCASSSSFVSTTRSTPPGTGGERQALQLFRVRRRGSDEQHLGIPERTREHRERIDGAALVRAASRSVYEVDAVRTEALHDALELAVQEGGLEGQGE